MPNAGQIQRQTQDTQQRARERERAGETQEPGLVAPEAPPPITLPAGGPTFLLKGVEFTPSELLPESDLKAIAARYTGKQVDLSALQTIANEVNILYADRGFVTASAILPEQDLSDGVLNVQLVEGRVGNVTMQGRKTLRPGLVRGAVDLPPDSVVDAPDLANSIDRFNRTSSARIQASLQPGASFGLTDINLSIIEPRRNQLQVFADNLGVESVGEWEGGALYQHYGLLGLDDRFSGYGLYAEGNLYGSAAYNLAVSPWGTRAGLSYTRSAIEIIQGPFANLEVEGASEIYSLNLAQPLVSSGPYFLLGNLAGSFSMSETEQTGVLITDDEIEKAIVGFSASYFGSNLNVTLSPTVSFAEADLKVTDETLGYELYHLSASLSYLIDDKHLFVARAFGQLASEDVLPGGDLFQIGGPATVRGYPTSGVAGDSGYFVNLELYRTMTDWLEGFAFFDFGTVYASFPDETDLMSAGVGLNFQWEDTLRAEVSVGVPLRSNVIADQNDAVVYGRLVWTLL